MSREMLSNQQRMFIQIIFLTHPSLARSLVQGYAPKHVSSISLLWNCFRFNSVSDCDWYIERNHFQNIHYVREFSA